MRELKYVLMFFVGIVLTHVLFNIADKVNPGDIKLNNILEIVVLFCYTIFLCLIYFDNKPKI